MPALFTSPEIPAPSRASPTDRAAAAIEPASVTSSISGVSRDDDFCRSACASASFRTPAKTM